MLTKLAVQLVQGTYENRLLMKLGIQANSQFLWHSLRLPMRFFSQRYVGDIITRMRGAESIPQTLVRNLAPVAVNVVPSVMVYGMRLPKSMITRTTPSTVLLST